MVTETSSLSSKAIIILILNRHAVFFFIRMALHAWKVVRKSEEN